MKLIKILCLTVNRQLGKRELYPTLGSQKEAEDSVEVIMWILNLADGTNDLISISERSGML